MQEKVLMLGFIGVLLLCCIWQITTCMCGGWCVCVRARACKTCAMHFVPKMWFVVLSHIWICIVFILDITAYKMHSQCRKDFLLLECIDAHEEICIHIHVHTYVRTNLLLWTCTDQIQGYSEVQHLGHFNVGTGFASTKVTRLGSFFVCSKNSVGRDYAVTKYVCTHASELNQEYMCACLRA